MIEAKEIRLTEFSHGSGCGCKIAPAVLEQILAKSEKKKFSKLLVGNETRDDAAVYDLGNGSALISTVDFFTPVVDDAFDFGRIASANALSDVYAMGGKPLLATAILGWPVEKLPAELASAVLKGAEDICAKANIPLAGGHSIDAVEPFFGLSVNGVVKKENLKANSTAMEGDVIFLTKPLGSGILSTAIKRKLANPDDYNAAVEMMTSLNEVGEKLGELKSVTSLTDVTGFGLLGHLIEMAEGSDLTAIINYPDIRVEEAAKKFIARMCFPDNLFRNWNAYEKKVDAAEGSWFIPLCDPQTNGGLLAAVSPGAAEEFLKILKQNGIHSVTKPIGRFTSKEKFPVKIIL